MMYDIHYGNHPFDVVGWDGCCYPFAFSIHDFEPITGSDISRLRYTRLSREIILWSVLFAHDCSIIIHKPSGAI